MGRRSSFTPGDVNDIFMGSLGEGRRKREVFTWRRGVYKRLAACYGVDRHVLDLFSDASDDPELAYREAILPLGEVGVIQAVKTEVTIDQLLDKPLDNPAFKALCGIKFNDPFRDGAGVVFPLYRRGDWILHTLGHPQGTLGGKSYIIIYANRCEDRDLIAESLDQFIKTRKLING